MSIDLSIHRVPRTRKIGSPERRSKKKFNAITSIEIPYEERYPYFDNVYYIYDDGTNVFRVTLEKNVAFIDKNTFSEEDYPVWKHLRKIKFKKIFIGCDNETNKGNSLFFGNSILLQNSKQKYTFIGGEIFEFVSKDQIQVFESPIKYPYGYTKDTTYLFWDKSYFPTLKGKETAEAEFIHERDNKEKIKKIDIKMIYEKAY